jgi:hypothetical protein
MLLHLCIKFHINIHMNKEAVKSYNFEKIFFLRTVEFLSNLTQEQGSGARHGFKPERVGWQRPALLPSRWLVLINLSEISPFLL